MPTHRTAAGSHVPAPRDPASSDGHHKYTRGRVWSWTAAAIGVALIPMLIGLVGPDQPQRPWLVEFGVGLGFVAIGLVALQFVASGRFQWVGSVFGTDVVWHFHRVTGIAAVIILLAHPVVLISREPDFVSYLDPTANFLRAVALWGAVFASTVLLATSVRREWFRLQYEHWRALHGGLATLVLLIGIVHGIQVSHHLSTVWQKALWIGFLGAAFLLVVHTRLVRPWLMRRRPYRIVEVREELPGTTTISLAPSGHDGMRFEPGQFAWITIDDTPFTLQQHPFSFSSSALDGNLSFTAKALGDFTGTWTDLEPGRRAFLEGPYGGFVLDDEAPGAVFIAGGIGVTPIMSMIRTLRDTGDPRPLTLFYATSRLDRAPFVAELAAASDVLDLDVIHVLEEPPEGWEGPSGFIDGDMLDRHLPSDRLQREYFVCGPDPMLDACEHGLRSLGVSWRRIYTERFEVV